MPSLVHERAYISTVSVFTSSSTAVSQTEEYVPHYNGSTRASRVLCQLCVGCAGSPLLYSYVCTSTTHLLPVGSDEVNRDMKRGVCLIRPPTPEKTKFGTAHFFFWSSKKKKSTRVVRSTDRRGRLRAKKTSRIRHGKR